MNVNETLFVMVPSFNEAPLIQRGKLVLEQTAMIQRYRFNEAPLIQRGKRGAYTCSRWP